MVIEESIYTPAKLSKSVRDLIKKDVKEGVHVNISAVIEERLRESYGLPVEKRVRLSSLSIGDKFMFSKNKINDEKVWEVVGGCSKRFRKCYADGVTCPKSCRAIVVKC